MAIGRPRRLDDLVDSLQSQGRYTFTRAEALAALGASAEAFKKAIQLLARRRRLVSPRRGFYVIVPVQYRVAGAPPASWYIDDFMKAVGTPYYVGVLTAAALHGAAHQAPQEFQVVTTTRRRTVVVGRERVRFLRKRKLARTPVMSLKTSTGTMRVSTPEATALDLLRYVDAAGFLSNAPRPRGEVRPGPPCPGCGRRRRVAACPASRASARSRWRPTPRRSFGELASPTPPRLGSPQPERAGEARAPG